MEDFKLNVNDLLIINTDKNGNFLNIVPESEEEKELLKKELVNTLVHKVKRLKNKVPLTVNGEQNIKVRSNVKTLKQCYKSYCEFLDIKHNNKRTIKRTKSICGVMFYFFEDKTKITDITKEDIKQLQIYLSKLPKNLNNITYLKDKNIRELIKKNSKILDKYEKINNRTIDNYIRYFKTMFNYFVESDFIIKSPFDNIKSLTKKNSTSKRSFTPEELNQILDSLDKVNKGNSKLKRYEERNLIIFNLLSGCRLSETLNIQIKDIDLKNRIIKITLEDTDTKKHSRNIPIHKSLMLVIKEQSKNKNKEDFLFFNSKKRERISENVSYVINNQMKKYLINKEDKKSLNIHSLRRNFIKKLYKSNIEELIIKVIVGHTVEDNITFNTYNNKEIDNQQLIDSIDKVDFKEFNLYNKTPLKKTDIKLNL